MTCFQIVMMFLKTGFLKFVLTKSGWLIQKTAVHEFNFKSKKAALMYD